MQLVNPSSFYTASNTGINKKHNIQNNYVNLIPLKSDIFFNGMKKTYDMDKAKTEGDIPKDANIFITSPKTKVKFPIGFNANEIIQTTKGMSWLDRQFSGDDSNKINLQDAEIGYVHGLPSEKKNIGCLELDNTNVDQVENIPKVTLNNNSHVNYINDVGTVIARDSSAGIVSAKSLYVPSPGSKFEEVNVYSLNCPPDVTKDSNTYTEITNVNATGGVGIDQVRVTGDLTTPQLTMTNSFANNVKASYCTEFKNSEVKNMTLANVKKLDGCKADKLNLSGVDTAVIFDNRTQIKELNIQNGTAKLFITKEKEWDKPLNNYIKKINVSTNKYLGGIPLVKIQGGINVEEINFVDTPGIVEFTKGEKYCPNVKINNGTAKYGVPTEVPVDDNDFED